MGDDVIAVLALVVIAVAAVGIAAMLVDWFVL
jgi:hypothetical protein